MRYFLISRDNGHGCSEEPMNDKNFLNKQKNTPNPIASLKARSFDSRMSTRGIRSTLMLTKSRTRKRRSRRGRGGVEETTGQTLRARSLGRADYLSGHGCSRERQRDRARHVRRESTGLPGLFIQSAVSRRVGPRFSVALREASAGTRAHRHLQSQLLRRTLVVRVHEDFLAVRSFRPN